MSISDLPPELVHRILELAVDRLPPSLKVRADTLKRFALVGHAWRVPAQILLEQKVQIASYAMAKRYMDRPQQRRRTIVDELEIFFDFVSPEDDEFYPLTESILRAFLDRGDMSINSLHLRSALFMNAFDVSLLRLPAFKGERETVRSVSDVGQAQKKN